MEHSLQYEFRTPTWRFLAAWLSGEVSAPLADLATLSASDALLLLRAGAPLDNHFGAPSALELARSMRDANAAPPGSAASLVLLAAQWSPASHHTFPDHVRHRVPLLLWLGKLLDRRCGGRLSDVWLEYVMPAVAHGLRASTEVRGRF